MADRIALIIANTEFEDDRLRSLIAPSNDARALADVLENENIGGFETRLLINETADRVRREIERLYNRRKRSDLVLLYYSGHGIKDDFGDLFLATQDTYIDSPSSTAIESAFVRRQLDKSGSQRKIIILDCCNSGAFSRGAKSALGTNIGMNEAFEGSGYGRVILTASNALEYAWEGDRLLGNAQQSVFSEHLVQGLQTGEADLDHDGDISIDELYEYVYGQLLQQGQTRQTPQKYAREVEGQIIIAKNPIEPEPAGVLPPWITSVLSDETVASQSRIAAVFQLIHLEKDKDQEIAARAREELEKLYDTEQDRSIKAAIVSALGNTAEQVVGPTTSQSTIESLPAPKTEVVDEHAKDDQGTEETPKHSKLEEKAHPEQIHKKRLPLWSWLVGGGYLTLLLLGVMIVGIGLLVWGLNGIQGAKPMLTTPTVTRTPNKIATVNALLAPVSTTTQTSAIVLSSTSEPLGGRSGRIAFDSDLDGNYEIYVVDVDGSNLIRLTNNDALDSGPSWSPDGEKIAFYSNRDGNYEIYMMDTAGGNPTRLTNNPATDWFPTWSPDGSQIAFTSDRDGNYEIYVMDTDGSNLIRLTNSNANELSPNWSPNGEKIAFHSNRDGNDDIYVMDIAGGNPTRLTNNPATDWFPTWSLDGSQITFASYRRDNYEVYVMDADGNNQINLTNNEADDSYPAWSP